MLAMCMLLITESRGEFLLSVKRGREDAAPTDFALVTEDLALQMGQRISAKWRPTWLKCLPCLDVAQLSADSPSDCNLG